LEIAKIHPLAQVEGPFGISEKLQDIMCKIGQSQVFEDGEELLLELLDIPVSGKQIQRVSEYYGEQIEEKQKASIEKGEPAPMLENKDETVYVMADGSMVYTREDSWKEMKVGRVFSDKDCIPIQENRKKIMENLYVCHLGEHHEFFSKLEYYADGYKKKVCIADGAKWIWKWAHEMYPEMLQILDYFHAVEKIGYYASQQFPDEKEKEKWLSEQKEKLLNNGVGEVIDLLEQSKSKNKEAEKTRINAIRYYQNNMERMQYKTYKDAGYLIGSGAIEAAHRNVVQQRLKLSGQRWSKKGAQQIVNLRAYKKSNRWQEVVNLIKKAA
jgi:hypothetical protein